MNTRREFFRTLGVVAVAGVGMAGSALASHLPPPAPARKKITHIVAGNEEWNPTADELQELIQMFQAAEKDPLGAIVATRHGIEFREVDSPHSQIAVVVASGS